MKKIIIIAMCGCVLVGCEPARQQYYYHISGKTSISSLSKAKYTCLQQSQQRVYSQKDSGIHTVNGQIVSIPGGSTDQVITNSALYNTCMQAKGFFLTEDEKFALSTYQTN